MLERCRPSNIPLQETCCTYPVEFVIKQSKIVSSTMKLTASEKRQILNKWDDSINY